MIGFFKVSALVAALAVPVYAAHADTTPKPSPEAAPKAETKPPCPGVKDIGAMHKDMGGMMTDMDAMMGSVTDPALKERMQKMHDQMATMQGHMQMMMGGGRMRGGMMGNGMMQNNAKPAAPPAPAKP